MHGRHGEVGLSHLLGQPVHLQPVRTLATALTGSKARRAGTRLTFLLVLQKITAWVMVRVSYRSHRVSNFHSSLSTATKNCLIPSRVSSSLRGRGYTPRQTDDHMQRERERLVSGDGWYQSGPGTFLERSSPPLTTPTAAERCGRGRLTV